MGRVYLARRASQADPLRDRERLRGGGRRERIAGVLLRADPRLSLVHDDLPAMDDDDYRRGHLTAPARCSARRSPSSPGMASSPRRSAWSPSIRSWRSSSSASTLREIRRWRRRHRRHGGGQVRGRAVRGEQVPRPGVRPLAKTTALIRRGRASGGAPGPACGHGPRGALAACWRADRPDVLQIVDDILDVKAFRDPEQDQRERAPAAATPTKLYGLPAWEARAAALTREAHAPGRRRRSLSRALADFVLNRRA